ncbi:MAG: tetratricopeptide repeat protein [Chloroflexota bacterium]
MEIIKFFQKASLLMLLITAAAGSIWPNTILLIAFASVSLSWFLFRLIQDRAFSRMLILCLLLTIFGLSAYLGWQNAYNPTNGFTKFLILSGAISLGALLSTFRSEDGPNGLVVSLSVGAFFLAGAFVSIPILDISRSDLLTDNRLAGLIAILTPFIVLAYRTASSSLRWILGVGFLSVCGVLIISGSRGGVVSLGIGLIAWWFFAVMPNTKSHNVKFGLVVSFILLIGLGATAYLLSPKLLNSPLVNIPGAESRIQLYANHRYLVNDYWLLGAGLDTFAGNYSQYILSVPFLRFTYGHHLYVDLLLELGLVGILAFLAIYLTSFYKIIQAKGHLDQSQTNFYGAILASIITLLLHGFIDDAVFGDSGSLLLLVPASLAFSLNRPASNKRQIIYISIGCFLIFSTTGLFFFNSIRSNWASNKAAIEMAKIELVSWPTNEWSSGEKSNSLNPIKNSLIGQTESGSSNVTASYRLGLIEMESRNFQAAVQHLELAASQKPNHIGIIKNLGYAHLWSGNFDEGLVRLSTLPDIQQEADAYIWWWASLDEPELSEIAQEAKNSGLLR